MATRFGRLVLTDSLVTLRRDGDLYTVNQFDGVPKAGA